MRKKYRRSYECPTAFSMDVLSGKWTTVILALLKERPMRYSEFSVVLPALSDKVLAERLHALIDAGLVVRRASGANRSAARYHLSERGETLRPILNGLYQWGVRQAGAYGVRVGAPLSRLPDVAGAGKQRPVARRATRVPAGARKIP